MPFYYKYINKYKSLPLTIKAAFWFTLYGFFNRGIGIITAPIFTRIMTPEQYGLFSVYTAWSGILVIFATLNLHQGVINNAFVIYENQKEKVVSAFQGLSTVLAILFLLFYLIFRDYINSLIELPNYLILLMFISFIFNPSINYWTIYKRYKFEYKLPVTISIFTAILIPVICYIFIINSTNKGEVRVLVTLLIGLFINLLFYIYNFLKNSTFFDKELWKLGLKINIPLIPHYLSEIILNTSDRIMIDKFSGTHQTGIYSLAYSASSIILIITSSINYGFVPWQYKNLKLQRYKELSNISNLVLIFVAVLLSFIVLFAPEIVRILAPPSYHEAIYVIPPVAAGIFFNYMSQLFARVEIYYNKPQYTMIGSVICAIVNILLNLIFIPIFGYISAAYTTLVSYLLICLIHFLFYRRICKQNKIKNIYNVKVLANITFIMLALTFLFVVVYKFNLIRYSILFLTLFIIFFNRKIIIKYLKIFTRN